MEPIVVHVRLKADVYRKFVKFDAMFRTGRLKKVILFSLTMVLLSFLVSLIGGQALDNNFRPNGLLLVIAVFVPLVFVGDFMKTVRHQIRRLGLAKGAYIYSLWFTDVEEGILAKNAEEERNYSWENVHAVYYAEQAIYLYVQKRHAFLLPLEQIEGGAEALWVLIEGKVATEKIFDQRKEKTN